VAFAAHSWVDMARKRARQELRQTLAMVLNWPVLPPIADKEDPHFDD